MKNLDIMYPDSKSLEKKEFKSDNFINIYILIEKYFNIILSRLIKNSQQNFLISKKKI